MGCQIRAGVRAGDERRRERMQRFHDLLNASLADEQIGSLPPQSLSQLRRDLERLPALRTLLQAERRRRRDVLRGARVLQRTSGCLHERTVRAA